MISSYHHMKNAISWTLALVVVALLVSACRPASDGTMSPEELYGAVMEIHDISMLKIDSIYIQIKALRDRHAILEQDSISDHNLRKKEIMEAITQLKNADDEMMDWMKQIKQPEFEDPAAGEYLRAQRLSIIEVDNKIDESLKHATYVLNKEKMPK